MTSAFPQFGLGSKLRCPVTNAEGYRCRREPQHDGPHEWDRCDDTDQGGHRCALPRRHPGRHLRPWYDRTTRPGQTHTINYGGTERYTGELADRVTTIVEGYGWVLKSRTFTPAPAWRATLSRLLGSSEQRGRVTLKFEYAGPGGASAQPASGPTAGNRRST